MYAGDLYAHRPPVTTAVPGTLGALHPDNLEKNDRLAYALKQLESRENAIVAARRTLGLVAHAIETGWNKDIPLRDVRGVIADLGKELSYV